MRGTISKIILDNFITYDHLELEPGKRMNMIIGPNGSGKSSVLCGICLGLGGKPKSIGRVTKVADYVKTGCNDATLHIELDDGKGNNRVTVIIRVINKSGQSTWSINGAPANQKQVEDTVATMSIHMDNLCQFLSQERVQDFSKMNSKELLVNTEKTVGTSEMYEYHMRLIDMCKDTHGQEKNVAALTATLGRENQRHDELLKRMESMTERLELLKNVKHLKCKKPWVEYNGFLPSIEEVKNDFKLACDQLKERKKALAPIEQAIKVIQTRLQTLKEELKVKVNHSAALDRAVETQDTSMQKLVENARTLNDAIHGEEKRVKELKMCENRLTASEQELEKWKQEYDPTQNQQLFAQHKAQLQKIDQVIIKKRNDREAKRVIISDVEQELRDFDYELETLTSAEQKRLGVLKRMDDNAYRASVWVRNHAHNFNGLVFGSILLEISMHKPEDSKYLEMLITYRDKKALLCERVDTMNQLVPQLKQELNVKINMLQAPNEKPDVTQVPRSELKRLGFENYVTDLFTCPLPIFNYICKSLRLHEVPIASSEEKVNMAEAQQKFKRFFAGDKFFMVNQSRYSGNYSVKVTHIGGSGIFANSVDKDAVDRTNNKRNEKISQRDLITQEMNAIQNEIREEEKNKDSIRKICQELNQKGDRIKEISIMCDRHRAKIRSIKNQSVNVEEMKKKFLKENKEHIRKAVVELPKLGDLLQKAYAQQTTMGLLSVEERGLVSRQMVKDAELRDLKDSMQELERQTVHLKRLVEERKKEGRRLLEVAKKVTGCAPGDPAFTKLESIFKNLPDTLHDIDCAIKDIEGRLEFFGEEDDNIVEELEKQRKLVYKLTRDLAAASTSCEDRKVEMEAIKQKWLPPLRELAASISKNFERLFAYMKCVGEVTLVEGQAHVENDFENYGLQILVKFRENEALQELCGTQSGGERSVSTAIYLLALQELTQVPFRCMDEINQGMDPTNERRIMDLMMKMSDIKDSCQYFVVTPKLLKDLTYAKSAKIMCVCQPKSLDTSKWTMANFLASARRLSGLKRQKTSAK